MPTSFRYSCFISWGFPCDCPGERRGRVGRRLTRRGGTPPRSPRGLPRVDDGVGRGRFKEAPQRAERGLLLAASALNAFGTEGAGRQRERADGAAKLGAAQGERPASSGSDTGSLQRSLTFGTAPCPCWESLPEGGAGRSGQEHAGC